MKDVAKWVHTVGRSRRANRARRKLSAPHATDGHGLVHELSDFTPHPRISVMGGASGRRGRMKFGLFVKTNELAERAVRFHATPSPFWHRATCSQNGPRALQPIGGNGSDRFLKYYCPLNPKTTPLTFRETEVWLSAYHGQAPFVKK